jgi:MFS family permease
MTALGALLMGVSSSVVALLVGRYLCLSLPSSNYILIYMGRGLVGIGAGLGICVGPIYLSEIAPSKIRGSVGMFIYFLFPCPSGIPIL